MNKHATSSDIARALTGGGFAAALAGTALAAALASAQTILTQAGSGAPPAHGFHARLATDALASDWVALALPVLCALPYAASYVDDVKTGFIKVALPRAGAGGYIRGKLTACALSGGLAVFAGAVLAYALAFLVFSPLEAAPAAGAAALPLFPPFLMKASLLFASGAFWSLAGFLVAALTMNKYMAYASPFILYYLLVILHERYFEELYVLYPREWLNPSALWVLGPWGVALLLLALSAAASLLFAAVAERRLAHG